MDRTEQLEIALWALLTLVDDGRLRTTDDQRLDRGLVPVWQGWQVLGDEAQLRLEAQLTEEPSRAERVSR